MIDEQPNPFATYEGLEKRWHTFTPDEQAQADELLLDASKSTRNHVSVYPETHEESWWMMHRRGLEIVCCQTVRTTMEQQVFGVLTGAMWNTGTTGLFSNSHSWASPDGYLRWNNDYLTVFGLDGQRAFSIDMVFGEMV